MSGSLQESPHSLSSLKVFLGSIIGFLQGDARSLDYSSYKAHSREITYLEIPRCPASAPQTQIPEPLFFDVLLSDRLYTSYKPKKRV